VVDKNAERLQHYVDLYGKDDFYFIIGDATDDEILRKARVETARGMIVALPSDKDSLIATVIGRQMNPKLRIVSKCQESSHLQRILKAGANSVISPNYIGGIRLVSDMIRPQVNEFLDLMLRDKDKNLRIEEIEVPEGSALVSKKLKDTMIRKITDLLVIAAKNNRTSQYIYNPGPDFLIQSGTVLIVLGPTDGVIKLREFMTPGRYTIVGKSLEDLKP